VHHHAATKVYRDMDFAAHQALAAQLIALWAQALAAQTVVLVR